MKQIIASVFFDILYFTIGNIIIFIFENFELNLIIITARVYKLRLAVANLISCFLLNFKHKRDTNTMPASIRRARSRF